MLAWNDALLIWLAQLSTFVVHVLLLRRFKLSFIGTSSVFSVSSISGSYDGSRTMSFGMALARILKLMFLAVSSYFLGFYASMGWQWLLLWCIGPLGP
jgi:hypothetical protein